eukprot:TRINITY_DN66297_c0_g1_i1.p1 TRINITY_DN66297_c0_g1~~TRINITY_DN66297_c0_g1_i1.p1  ORF type:complete len:196 (-),score=34.05 TRINITY_DN66297_c0_g1_i1:17-577(-)
MARHTGSTPLLQLALLSAWLTSPVIGTKGGFCTDNVDFDDCNPDVDGDCEPVDFHCHEYRDWLGCCEGNDACEFPQCKQGTSCCVGACCWNRDEAEGWWDTEDENFIIYVLVGAVIFTICCSALWFFVVFRLLRNCQQRRMAAGTEAVSYYGSAPDASPYGTGPPPVVQAVVVGTETSQTQQESNI